MYGCLFFTEKRHVCSYFLPFTYQNGELIALYSVWRCDYMKKSTPARERYSATVLTTAQRIKSEPMWELYFRSRIISRT
jgi:hypothetical protein